MPYPAPAPALRLVDAHAAAPSTCPRAQMGRSTRAPGVHLLPAGGHAADMRRYELVSDDGVVLHTGWTALAGLLEPEEDDAIMWHLRDLLNDRLQAHTCPECRRPTRTRRLA